MGFRAGQLPGEPRRRVAIPYLAARADELRRASDLFMQEAMRCGSEDRAKWEAEANLCARWAGDIEEELK